MARYEHLQVYKSVYDINLYQALVDTAGTVTLTDERTFARPGTDAIVTAAITDLAVTTAKIAADAVTASKIADGAIDTTAQLADSVVTAAKIANRAATLFVASAKDRTQYGDAMNDGITTNAYMYFAVPPDYVSGLTVTPVIVGPTGVASGNVYLTLTVDFGAHGEALSNTATVGPTAVASPATSVISKVSTLTVTPTAPAIGDYMVADFSRAGAHANDTSSNAIYCLGVILDYTADS